MPIFQTIPDNEFNYNGDFVVKEARTTNLVIGIFFLLIAVGALAHGAWPYGIPMLLIAVAAMARSSKNTTVMTINKTGFYYYGDLLTDWDHFISDEFIDEVPLPSRSNAGLNDQFFVMIKYYKEGQPGYFGRKIPLTDTQDRSEEEIMAAIKFYYTNFEKAKA